MTKAFTNAEVLVAQVVANDALNIANDNDIEAGAYMEPVARAVIRGDLGERAMASLGRELLQRYLADVAPLVHAADAELEEAIAALELRRRVTRAALPNHLLYSNSGRLV